MNVSQSENVLIFTTLGEGGREREGGRKGGRYTERDRSVLSLARRLSIVSGFLERSRSLYRDQSLGVVTEFKCIMGSDWGTVISSN